MASKLLLFGSLVHLVYGNNLRGDYTIDVRSAFDQDLYESVLDSARCQRQLDYLRNNYLNLPFLDASARFPSGFRTGNVNDLGDYFQCLSINTVRSNMQFKGKYCVIKVPFNQIPIQFPDPEESEDIENSESSTTESSPPEYDNETVSEVLQYEALRQYALGVSGFGEPVESRIIPIATTLTEGSTFGFCIPHVCTTREAIDFLQEEVDFLNFTYNEYFCRLPNDKPYSGADYTAMVIFGLLTCIIIISTSYDLFCCFVLKDPKSASVLYRCFSVFTNIRRLLTFNTIPGALECVDGIRAISMMWVVVGHTYSFTLLGYIHNLRDTLSWLTKFSSTWVNSAPITVDTFFMLSGILAVYTTVGKISRRKFLRTLHLFYINRLLRMFPLLATVVLLQASLFNHMSDGPFWLNVSQQAENCRTWWWSALLHVQNYVNALEICIPQSWYLSVDVQLYFICPIVMVWLFGRELFSWIALCAIILLSLVSSTIISFYNNFSAALANPIRLLEFNDYVTIYYVNTLARAPPFFIGMVYGYLLHLCRNKEILISKLNVTILWGLSLAMMAFCIFSTYPVMQTDHTAQSFDNFLNAYMRAIWAGALGWLIFACVHGYGGPINRFLSLKMWKLPARLSFAMYLVHVSIILIANGSWTKTKYFTEGDNIYRFMSDITLTFLAAFILCIAIDAPFSTLQKLLMGRRKESPEKQNSESQENIAEDLRQSNGI